MKEKTPEYFSHDYNAENDPKMLRLRMKWGNEGYGIFWLIVERLYRAGGRLQADTDALAFDLRAEPAAVKSIVEDFGLFHADGDKFGSSSVDRRLEERRQKYSEISDKRREAGKKGNAVRWGDSSQTVANRSQSIAKEKGKVKDKEQLKEKTTDIAPSPSDSPPVLVFQCAGTVKDWALTEAKLAEYAQTFPGIDVKAQCRIAWQWTVDHPTKRKTASGMPAFLSRWLGKQQNESGGRNGNLPQGGRPVGTRVVGDAQPVAGKYGAL